MMPDEPILHIEEYEPIPYTDGYLGSFEQEEQEDNSELYDMEEEQSSEEDNDDE